jgi:hypothetical protein
VCVGYSDLTAATTGWANRDFRTHLPGSLSPTSYSGSKLVRPFRQTEIDIIEGQGITMKVQSIKLNHFKKFPGPQLFDFTESETGLARDLIVLVGMNGSGKTSILQSIAAVLGVATGRLKNLSELKWHGFNFELLGANWGKFEPQIDLQVQFSNEEIRSTRRFVQKLQGGGQSLQMPAENHVVELKWHGNHVRAGWAPELFQSKHSSVDD